LATRLTAAAVVSFEIQLPLESGKSGQTAGTQPNNLVANSSLCFTAEETLWNGQVSHGLALPCWQQQP